MEETRSQEVNYNEEGAIEGHPFLSRYVSHKTSFLCQVCEAPVSEADRLEMLKEII